MTANIAIMLTTPAIHNLVTTISSIDLSVSVAFEQRGENPANDQNADDQCQAIQKNAPEHESGSA